MGRVTAIFVLLAVVGCPSPEEVTDAEATPDVHVPPDDTGAVLPGDSSDIPDALDPGEPQPPKDVFTPICIPGLSKCLVDDDGEHVLSCDEIGAEWLQTETCGPAQKCDPAVGACVDLVCVPGGVVCVDGGKGESVCLSDGSGINQTQNLACEQGAWCFDDAGCVPTECPVGAIACLGDGTAGLCDGFEYEALAPPCTGGSCVVCVSDQQWTQCGTDGLVAPAVLKSCPGGTGCADALGCMPAPCGLGWTQCGLGKNLGTCNEAGWTAAHCNDDQLCVPLAPNKAECQFDCGASVDCIIDACHPLPPFGGASPEEWMPPPNPTTLDVAFGVGLTDDPKIAFVNLAPIVNPQTGEFLQNLVPLSEVAGVPKGNIRVLEDGEPRSIACTSLTNTQFAQLDIAFILDVTGSMGTTLKKVKDTSVDLAAFLQAVGLDVRFGVVPYDDVAPASGGLALDLTEDIQPFKAFVNQLVADGGGDGPENGLDAVAHAAEHFSWRPGAQRVMVLMTDAVMHAKGDGSPFSQNTLEGVLEKVGPQVVIHTVSINEGVDLIKADDTVDPRGLSCATGGTSSNLTTFLADDIQESLFAVALSHSVFCIFATQDPFGSHVVQVEVQATHEDISLYGSSTQQGVSYKP